MSFTYFLLVEWFHGYSRVSTYLLSQMMYCLSVLPFSLQYLMNAEYLIGNYYVKIHTNDLQQFIHIRS